MKNKGRPKARVVLSIVDEPNNRKHEVLAAEDVYGVFYNGTPVILRNYVNPHFGYVQASGKREASRYKRMFYPHKVSALNAARKMNEMFGTNLFEVYRIAVGERVE